MEMKVLFLSVRVMALACMTVATVRMLVSDVKVLKHINLHAA